MGGHEASIATGWLWRIVVLAAASAIGTAYHAEAALYYWSDSDSAFSQPGPMFPQRRQKPRRRQGKKLEAPVKESAKPQGPLIIAISIDKQKLKIYDANGFFAETPISTGMRGHPTPMGVFSVIQKHKWHRSNIYSGAPMPFMQRITWSGIAIHAGVLPGYPASHGCIRMPMGFAVKMWGWTKMGARVVITPGEMTPASFSHPVLATRKVVPQPSAANESQPDTPPATAAAEATNTDAPAKSVVSETDLELRSTVGHTDGGVKPVMGQPTASTPLREQTHTADAAGALPTSKAPITVSDAGSIGNASPLAELAAAEKAPSATPDAASVRNGEASNTGEKSGAAKLEAEPTTAKHEERISSGDKPVETDSSEAAAGGIKSAETAAPETKVEAKPDGVKAVTDVGTRIPDLKIDAAQLPDAEKPAVSKSDAATVAAPKRNGQIAVLISRKDSKLYVRQNFAPLFEVPITIAPSDRPLGTHVFTAQIDKNDANLLHWSVVSLPVAARNAERRDEDEGGSRRRKMVGAVEVKAMPVPDTPAEALDRLTIPADIMGRITEALSTGGSIIVSDQGIAASETGEGTDFIVSLR
jgi:lipoprotein-anchoring transpeptidase ErfK/SrfK